MYRLAVFDIDGTLIDTERTGVESLVLTIRELMGKEVSYEEAYKVFGIPSGKVAGLLGYADARGFGDRWEERPHGVGVPLDGARRGGATLC